MPDNLRAPARRVSFNLVFCEKKSGFNIFVAVVAVRSPSCVCAELERHILTQGSRCRDYLTVTCICLLLARAYSDSAIERYAFKTSASKCLKFFHTSSSRHDKSVCILWTCVSCTCAVGRGKRLHS
jgi:hypothetical protein